MNAIVRCVGMEHVELRGIRGIRDLSRPSCGWTSPDGTASNFCPNCLGEVELIPEVDPAWDDGFADAPEPPLLDRVPWRIGVLDKDLFESPQDVQAHSLLIAGWYVHDCAQLLELLQTAQADAERLRLETQALRAKYGDQICDDAVAFYSHIQKVERGGS